MSETIFGFIVIILRKEIFQAIKGESLSLENKIWGQNIQMLFLSCSVKTQIWRFLRWSTSCKKIDVSRTTIRRALTESDYKCVGPIIKPKNTMKERRKRFNWCMRQINKEWTKVLMRQLYILKNGGFKWVHKDEQNIFEVKRRRGKI